MKRSLQVCLAVVCLLAFGASDASAQTTALFIDSQPGDPVGQGQRQTWTPAELAFTSSTSSQGAFVAITARSPSGTSPFTSWTLSFSVPSGQTVAAGTYENAARASTSLPGPGFDASGTGGSCSRVVARFQIFEIIFDAAGRVAALAADFEQHCEDAAPALFGAIRFNASRGSLVPFDGAYPVYSLRIEPSAHGWVTGQGLACGAWLSDCEEQFSTLTSVSLQATPAPGFMFAGWVGLDCAGDQVAMVAVSRRKACAALFAPVPWRRTLEIPDYADALLLLDGRIGNGESGTPAGRQRHAFIRPGSDFAPTVNGSQVGFTIRGPRAAQWSVTFGARLGEVLQPGLYEYTIDSSVSGQFPILRLTGTTAACFAGSGRFFVHEVEYVGGTVARFAADFELPCSSGPVAGAVRYHSTRSSPVPFDGQYPAYTIRVFPSTGGFVTGSGIDCGQGRPDCDETFGTPSSVTLEAVPLAGYDFFAWSGSCTGGSPTAIVVVDRSKRCAAVFQPSTGSGNPPDVSLGSGALFLDMPGSTAATTRKIWLRADSFISVSSFSFGTVSFSFSSAMSSDTMSVAIGLPGGRLIPGDYPEASQSGSTTFPHLSVNGCSQRAGRFRIYEATYDSADRLQTFAADFEVHCSGSTPLIAGALRYASTRAALRPFDGAYPLYALIVKPAPNGVVVSSGVDCGPGSGHTDCSETYSSPATVALKAIPSPGYRFVGWTGGCDGASSTTIAVTWVKVCAALFGAVPFTNAPEDSRLSAGSLFIDSRPGDPVGMGRRHIWLGGMSGSLAFSPNSVSMRVSVPEGSGGWEIVFRAPGTSPLTPGVYENATDSSGTSSPGLSVRAPFTFGGSCSGSAARGRFVVYEVSLTPNGSGVLSFAADFEYRCSPTSPPLYGSVRYNSSRSELRPFAPARPAGDITGDFWTDALFQNRADGRLLAWGMNRGMKVGDVAISPSVVSDTLWHVVGTGDANRDGHIDLYWHHQGTGDLAIWLMNGPTQVAGAWIMPTPVSDTQWKVKTIADLDVDGYPDLIWHHTGTGTLAVTYLTGNVRRTTDFMVPDTMADPAWNLSAAADVNGDDYPDLLWHNTATGQLRVWYMQGHTRIAEDVFLPDRLSDTSWRLRGAVDLDRNGYPDLIWQNTATFEIGAWLLDGVTVIGGQWLGPPLPSADWYLVSPK
jgi:hypothetical protein